MYTVDRSARNDLASAIDQYLSRAINNGQLDRALYKAFQSEDPACHEFSEATLLFSSEWDLHSNSGKHAISERNTTMIRRWVAFLRTELPWPNHSHFIPRKTLLQRLAAIFKPTLPPGFTKNELWPYDSAAAWQSAELISG